MQAHVRQATKGGLHHLPVMFGDHLGLDLSVVASFS